ncbi:hypothetical protein HCC61_26145 [Streptomyces sp. HNM0575]|uniref:hypothetical protein n=1 Tax=Streptomyces sp. HNM0575 TaxID=2716338 RepID=UPI00145DCD4A|nr:hypothetical protein [Streptomyces sp. HNM0575]NLU76087.1 hypothetical protein [Streptomyces sp. HNM0575]
MQQTGETPVKLRGSWRSWTFVRGVPFVVLAVASVWAASRAPDGRQAPRMDWSLDGESVLLALTKWPHFLWMAVLFCLAVLAVSVNRLGRAAGLTLVVGLAWELAETTVIGHNPRIADLVPDVVSVALTSGIVVGIRTLTRDRSAASIGLRRSGS